MRLVRPFSELGVVDIQLSDSVIIGTNITIPIELYKEVEHVSKTSCQTAIICYV